MKGYWAFTKKELVENWMNFRLFILLFVFLMFGATSPILAKIMPELLAELAPQMGLTNTIPVAADAWEQFYKNITGVGFSAFIILFGGMLSGEYAKGTLPLLVTKGLSRRAIILAKITGAALVLSLCFWASFAISYGLTAYLWPGESLPHALLAGVATWVMGLFYLSVLMLGCVIFRQAFTSILFTGGAVALLSLTNLSQTIANLGPFALLGKIADLLAGEVVAASFILPFATTGLLALFSICGALGAFQRKQL